MGIDLSKTVFQLFLADSRHHVIDRRRLSPRQFSRFLATAEPAHLVWWKAVQRRTTGRALQSSKERGSSRQRALF